jgi:hypothetical protein
MLELNDPTVIVHLFDKQVNDRSGHYPVLITKGNFNTSSFKVAVVGEIYWISRIK